MANVFSWIIEHWATVTAGLLILVRFVESGLTTKKWDFVALIKEFFTLR